MSETAKKILENFGKTVPKLSEMEKEKLLAFSEGVAFMSAQNEKAAPGGDSRNAGT